MSGAMDEPGGYHVNVPLAGRNEVAMAHAEHFAKGKAAS